jgi:hypothetical protein
MTNEERWNKVAHQLLVGRTVTDAFYMPARDARENGFQSRPLAIAFDNGLVLFPLADDEGNDAGALATTDAKNPLLPVL